MGKPSKVTRRSAVGMMMLTPLGAYAGAAPSGTMKQPNFLFLLPDQLRFDWLGGGAIPAIHTPNLELLARRGVRFAKAYCSSPICAPSRACLALGREYDECGVDTNAANLPTGRETYYGKLREAGYHVAACGKLDLAKGEAKIGVDGRNHMAQWGFTDMINCGGKGDAVTAWRRAGAPAEPYMAYLDTRGQAKVHADDIDGRGGRTTSRQEEYSHTEPTPLADDDYEDNWIGRCALDLMSRFPKGKPWHLVVNFAGPHDPMDVTKRMEATVRGRPFPQPNRNDQLAPEVHTAIRQNYTAMVENIDRWAGILIKQLEQRGELDNTVIVFSSDHGEMLGDHNLWAKNFPYEASACVPMIVAGPGVIPRAKRTDVLVSLVDVGATFLDYAGATRPAGMTAQSFRPLLEGRSRTHRQYAHSGFLGWRLVTDGRYKLVRGFDPAVSRSQAGLYAADGGDKVLLFDIVADPLENEDIASARPDIVARLTAQLPPPNPDPNFGKPRRGGAEGRGARTGGEDRGGN